MRIIDERTFLGNPMRFINLAAYENDFTTLKLNGGHGAVIISETDWAMLLQAFKLCTEHPEWTRSN